MTARLAVLMPYMQLHFLLRECAYPLLVSGTHCIRSTALPSAMQVRRSRCSAWCPAHAPDRHRGLQERPGPRRISIRAHAPIVSMHPLTAPQNLGVSVFFMAVRSPTASPCPALTLWQYIAFQAPSNLVLKRVGPKVRRQRPCTALTAESAQYWLTFLVLCFGAITLATAYVPNMAAGGPLSVRADGSAPSAPLSPPASPSAWSRAACSVAWPS
jgi:hypothetical protein